ncbi:hypothetical protein M6D93_01535 [Jatrophihabitans telluris]|uniref:RHS repeat-associated core domain-containing protein n=1 Tax=Jatrophihabitans telluris TaxID=2038343 RepID=A0ABY4QZN0_9ACTN|nr:hypothetical protein [Jatrophihabitans telluris]UQX88697.1 hypothetical protein M6D93_01535 [Jatrophihabitans telluris]
MFYNPDGSIANQIEVSGGALSQLPTLAGEQLHFRYTAVGGLLALNAGASSYVARAQYTGLGHLAQYTQGYGTLINVISRLQATYGG